MSSRLRPLGFTVALVGMLSGGSAACMLTSHDVIDATMTSAYRPKLEVMKAAGLPSRQHVSDGLPSNSSPLLGRYQLLSGDMHCHVMPPDHPSHVSRGPEQTVTLAHQEQLDFVVLTPHVSARFFNHKGDRKAVLDSLRRLQTEIEMAAPGPTTFVYGLEYTDHRYGHVALAFADLKSVLASVPVEATQANPAKFFEAYVQQGGIVVINHPLVTPLDSVFSMARANLSWRPFTAKGPFPSEINAVSRLAHGLEAYNLTVTHLRDRYLLLNTDFTLQNTLALMDQEIVRQRRPMIPTGGTDSHSGHLRPMMYVWSDGRSENAIRQGIVGGRVCIRAPEACSLVVRPVGQDAWSMVGASLQGVHTLDVKATGQPIQILVNGEVVESPESDQVVHVAVEEGRCSVVRAHVGEGFSGPIYANCAFGR